MIDPDSDEACEMCRGTGAVAYGPWGARPPKKTCPECGGTGSNVAIKVNFTESEFRDTFGEKALEKVKKIRGE